VPSAVAKAMADEKVKSYSLSLDVSSYIPGIARFHQSFLVQ